MRFSRHSAKKHRTPQTDELDTTSSGLKTVGLLVMVVLRKIFCNIIRYRETVYKFFRKSYSKRGTISIFIGSRHSECEWILLNISDNFIESYSDIIQNRLNYYLKLEIKSNRGASL